MIQEIMNMISTATNLLHPMMTHFPLALLSASFVLDIAAHWWPKLRTSGWVLLILGTIGAIFAVITGNVDGELYEDSSCGRCGGNPPDSGHHHHGDLLRVACMAFFCPAQRKRLGGKMVLLHPGHHRDGFVAAHWALWRTHGLCLWPGGNGAVIQGWGINEKAPGIIPGANVKNHFCITCPHLYLYRVRSGSACCFLFLPGRT